MPTQKETGLICTGENVRRILAGIKSQTRRVVKPQPEYREYLGQDALYDEDYGYVGVKNSKIFEYCPYGKVGDRLWVRESFQIEDYTFRRNCVGGKYLADNKEFWTEVYLREYDLIKNRKFPLRATSGRFMYKSLARIWLEITGVRVERAQDISESDAVAEGIDKDLLPCSPYELFANLWDSINAKRGYGWDTNCWVWIIEFRQLQEQPKGGE